ncbi:probable transcription factor At1g44810 [Typha latifolia]|uniref:probable transcription factor At1g44810 n=1 Tax=Typha latifolia TaxID=4733 RepID=UPI003C2EF41F
MASAADDLDDSEEDPAAAAGSGPSDRRKRRRIANYEAEPRAQGYQKLWTEADEIAILEGFLEFVTERGTTHANYQHDTGPFYDRIKGRLQIEFNKNQLVEKLRRLKKKYRNTVARMERKDFSFRSPHEKATFEIARNIWSPNFKPRNKNSNDQETNITSASNLEVEVKEDSGKAMEEKWRKQRILELEVFLKRVDLVHEVVAAKLEELTSKESG